MAIFYLLKVESEGQLRSTSGYVSKNKPNELIGIPIRRAFV